MKGSIVICTPKRDNLVFATKFLRWFDVFRPHLFSMLQYASVTDVPAYPGHIPKISTTSDISILRKLLNHTKLETVLNRGNKEIYCHRIASYFVKSVDFVPYFWNESDGKKKSEDYKIYTVNENDLRQALMAILNSGVFYYFWHVYGDGYHCGKAAIENFRCNFPLSQEMATVLNTLAANLSKDYRANSCRRETQYKTTGKVVYDELYPKHSKPIIDDIDRILAEHYGFSDEELDLIINYDINYRMGSAAEEDN